jgi:hypothetical protein
MMKLNTLRSGAVAALLLLNSWLVQGKPVNEETAKLAGHNFMLNALHVAFKQDISMDLAYTSASTATATPGNPAPVYFYVFNTDNGFVIVAGDDNVKPVLAYSTEKKFFPEKMSPDVYNWLNNYKVQIRDVMENEQLVKPSAAVTREWTSLLNSTPSAMAVGKTNSVTPLLKTTWDQTPYYNALCPYDYNSGKRAVTGCVATAMAQVMKFWGSPSKGSGFHSYSSQSFGTLSADFGNTTYDWSSMPSSINSNNTAIATLMYHCGVSVDMNYGVESSGAYAISSGSPVTNCAEYALKTYFGYKSTLSGLERVDYSDVTWLTKIETELDAGRPVIYTGFGSGGGHCFVADGYDSRNYLHFNWGWSGYYNGYFTIDALNPGGVGTGGGSGGYNSGQQVIIGIEPSDNSNNGGGNNNNASDMEINDYLTLSSASIRYGQAFSVSTNILNNSTNDFNGDYCAAVFDNTGTFVQYIDSFIGVKLPAGYTYSKDISFNCNGSYSMLPGTYTIGVYYRPKGGNWVALSNNGSYSNYAQITVTNANAMEMYAAINITSGTPLIQGSSVTVKLDLANYGADFTGLVDLSLYNLDGTGAATIQQLSNISLPAGDHFSNGLTFTNSNLNLTPGTYLMAVLVKPNTSSSWQLAGSTYYQNPIKVVVQKPALKPDKYEQNNNVATAYDLIIGYAGNTGYASTDGANCHQGSDLDFYKVDLDTNYTYSISATLNDINNGGSGGYTLDGIYSYSTDGTSWSDTYDGTLATPIAPKNGVLYFEVSPAFAGVVGTYLLEINITRTPKQTNTGLAERTVADIIGVYPNPAKDQLNIDLSSYHGQLNRISLVNLQGQIVYMDSQPVQKDKMNISLSGLAAGIYTLQLQSGDKVINKKIVVTP